MKKIVILSTALLFGSFLVINAQVAPKASTRQGAQHARIEQGAKSGELSQGEAGALKAQQRHINRQKRYAKADGVVTPREKAKLNRKQNRASKNIATQKND